MLKVIFIKKINNNNINKICKVKKGYAINYLIPYKYALLYNKKK